ncbi:MAG: hypothetical protein RLN81_15585 [Balneolaceae bacterium]
MKSLKSLFALLTIVSMSFACASVTDASLTEEPDTPDTEINAPAGTVFGGDKQGTADSKPVI